MKNFHTDDMFTCRCERKCAVKTDRLGGSAHEMRFVRFEAEARRPSSVCMTSKYRDSDSNFESMQSHLLSVALAVL